jgi:hypothetical protein
MEARYGRKDYVEERVTFRHRFLMVVDGNSFSTRRARHTFLYAGLRSMSAPWRHFLLWCSPQHPPSAAAQSQAPLFRPTCILVEPMRAAYLRAA